MGTRLCISSKMEPNKLYGDDHKFYGYYEYETLKNSWEFLWPIILQQWDDYYSDIETAEDGYELFTTISCCGTDDLILTENQFKGFSEKYLKNLRDTKIDMNNKDNALICTKPTLEGQNKLCDDVQKYFNHLNSLPGDKILYWR